MQAEVAYLIKTPITTKPVVCTNYFVHDLASLRWLHQQNKLIFSSSSSRSSSHDCSSDCQQSNTTMTMTINKVDDFLEAFPNKVIKHTGRPDYETLNNIKTALKRNFATVPCTLGGGTPGYLATVLTAAKYAMATPNNTLPFVDPLFPGAAAVIPPNSTGPQIAAIECQFNKAL